jgi:DNA-binding GntR family transcriptional regulator
LLGLFAPDRMLRGGRCSTADTGRSHWLETILTRLKPSTLTDDAYRVLKAAILNLELAPGAALNEQQIAKQLGISKTPVREALAKLGSEGFVVTGTGRKSFVAGLSHRMVQDVYGVRVILEPAVVRDIISHISESDVDELQRIADDARAAFDVDDVRGYLEGNRAFHRFLVKLARNDYLLALHDGVYDHAYRVRAAIHQAEVEFNHHKFAQQGFVHHDRIIASLRARDVDAATTAMRDDVRLYLDLVDTAMIKKALKRLGTIDHQPWGN